MNMKHAGRLLLVALLLICALACGGVKRSSAGAADSPRSDYDQVGMASYYAEKYHGKKTASGELHNKNDMVGAHRSLDFGTEVKVTNLQNGKTVTVRINDRGPFVDGRVIDLSRAAAEKLDMIGAGLVRVGLEF
ncbi:MAG: septal ring lytic transglycosylase RlpA family protein [Candidatus Sumerlaeia bacterium]